MVRARCRRYPAIFQVLSTLNRFRATLWLPSPAPPVFRLLWCLAGLFLLNSSAHASYQVFLAPKFVFRDGLLSTPYRDTVAQAWADAQSIRNRCVTFSGGASECWTETNLHPTPVAAPVTWDGIPLNQFYDQIACDTTAGGTTTCQTAKEYDFIQTTALCPPGFGANFYGTSSTARLLACVGYFSDLLPPQKDCKSCIGNPIYASTGEKLQIEADYSGVPGQSFSRTYRSNMAFSASATTVAFIDYSPTIPATTQACYVSTYVDPNTSAKVPYCFAYTSSATGVYQLATEDGRYIQFSGPNSAITEKADVNERVVQVINPSGAVEWHVTREDDSTEIYNSSGSLVQKVQRNGQATTYTYSDTNTLPAIAPRPGLLISQTDAFGHALSWQYNAASQMTQMTDPGGGLYHYSYDGAGNLTGVTYPDGSSKIYSYNETAETGGTNLPNAMTGITDESGVRFATFHYDSSGRGVSTEHAGGVEKYSLSFTSPDSQTVVTDPLGASRIYKFQYMVSYLRDTSQTQPAASGSGTVTTSHTYDAHGNPASLTDYVGNRTCFSYDLTRNLETVRVEGFAPGISCPSNLGAYTPTAGTRQRKISTTWNSTYRLPTLITEPNRTTALSYDTSGNLLGKTVTDTHSSPNVSRIWTYTYDGYGRVLTVDGPRTDVSDVTTYSYYTCTTGYQCGQVQTVSDAAGNVTTYNTYNAHGQPLTISDPNGVVTTLVYDSRLRLTSRQVGTETTTFSYWPTGLLKQVTLPDTSYILYSYDAAHRLTQVSDGLGNAIDYTLDAMGNRTAENVYDPSNALHRTHSRVFNSLSQLYQDVNAAGTAAVTTTFGFDNNGNQTSVAAPLSRNTANAYDELNRLKQITDPASGITQFGYDANDNLTSVIDPKTLTTSYTYTGFGDLQTQVSPDTGTTTNTHDSGGNLATATDARGAVSTYTYDALNRVASVAYSLSGSTDQTVAFTYDSGTNGRGHLTGASDANHSLSWTYDALGRVTGKSQI